MIWVILCTGVGLLLGTLLSRPALKATGMRAGWTTLQPPDTVGGVVSAVLVLLGLASLFFCFGTLAAGLGAIAGAIGAAAWSAVRKSAAEPPWLRAAQGASVGIVAVPLVLGTGLALASLGGPLGGNPELWRDLVGYRAFPAWVAIVRSGKPEYRHPALLLLRSSSNKAAPIFMEAVSNEDALVRGGAAEGLGELKPVGAYEKVVPLLADPDTSVRRLAVTALAKLNDPRAITELFVAVGKAKDFSDEASYARVAKALPGGAEAARACVMGEGLCGGNEDARYGAIKALDAMTQMESDDVTPVMRALRDPSPRIRKTGMEACRNLIRQWAGTNGNFFVSLTALNMLTAHQRSTLDIDPNELIVAAAPLLEDKDPQLRTEAQIWVPSLCEGSEGMNNVDGPSFDDPDGRFYKLDSRRIAPVFLRIMERSDRKSAGAAARALAYLGDRRAIPVLKERDAAENSTYNCLYCIALDALGVGPLAHSKSYPGAPQ